jgi:hypothetical protein
MATCACHAVSWKNRRAYRLTNGCVELTALLGGGHIADFRLCGSPINAIWEAPWETIEPQAFSEEAHAHQYGDGPAGRMLCGYTGHSLALGYFGMPNEAEAERGLPLHGEPAGSEWTIMAASHDERSVTLTMETEAPSYTLRFRRQFTLLSASPAVRIMESVTNYGAQQVDFQWVQHATFGEPLFAIGESSLTIPASRARTWPLDYEGASLLARDREFTWPQAPSVIGPQLDLSRPFQNPGSGFLACALLDPNRQQAFVAVHNRRLSMIAGYCFDRERFPWVTLWEENQARSYPPWNAHTRARGVEFGNTPLPLGLAYAKAHPQLFGVPTFSTIRAGTTMNTTYHLFLTPVATGWQELQDIRSDGGMLVLVDRGRDPLRLSLS